MINHLLWSYSLFFSGKQTLSCHNSTCLLLCNWGALEISIWIFASNFSWQAVCVKPFPACYTQDLQLISHVSMAGGSIAYRPLTFIMYNKMLHALCQFFSTKCVWTWLQIHARFTAFLACSPSFVFGFCSTCSLQLQKSGVPKLLPIWMVFLLEEAVRLRCRNHLQWHELHNHRSFAVGVHLDTRWTSTWQCQFRFRQLRDKKK